jgi:hypothetical protein
MRYVIADTEFNRINYPTEIGRVTDAPPSYASVRPVITCCGNDEYGHEGYEVVCDNHTNTCDWCGTSYTAFGQMLSNI